MKPQNPSCKIGSNFQNLKTMNLEVAGGDLKGGGVLGLIRWYSGHKQSLLANVHARRTQRYCWISRASRVASRHRYARVGRAVRPAPLPCPPSRTTPTVPPTVSVAGLREMSRWDRASSVLLRLTSFGTKQVL